MRIIKKRSKFILSIVLILCMTLTTFVHADFDVTTEITIFNSEGVKQVLNNTYKYLVNGIKAKGGTLGKNGCTAYFERNGYLNLKDFEGQSIQGLENNHGSLSIRLEGNNTITNKGSGVRYGIVNQLGNIIIMNKAGASSTPALNIDVESSNGSPYGILGGMVHTALSDVFIGGVDVTIISSYTGNGSYDSYGVLSTNHFGINQNTSFTTRVTGRKTCGISAMGNVSIMAGNTRDIVVESYGTYSSSTLHSNAKNINLYSANSLQLKWSLDNLGPDISYTNFAKSNRFIDNNGNRNVDYRYGTPYTLTVDGGFNENGYSTSEYLEGDPVTVTAKGAVKNEKFKEWETTDLTSIDLTGSTMTFNMPANDVELNATYEQNVYSVQPKADAEGIVYAGERNYFSWTISDFEGRVDYVHLQKKEDGVWKNIKTMPDSAKSSGQHTDNVYRDTNGSDTYRLYYKIFPTDFYSDEFTLTWYMAQATEIQITPSSAEVIKGNALKFSAVVSGLGNYNDEVKWELLNAQSPFTKITQDGLLTVAENETASTFRVKGSVVGTHVSQFITITVKDPPAYATGISISPIEVELSKSQSYRFIANVTGIGDFNDGVVWSISGHQNQTIDENTGNFTVNTYQNIGDIIRVTATSADDPSISATAKVTVVAEGKITNLTISPRIVTVERGKTYEFTANITGTGNFIEGVLWQLRSVEGYGVNSSITSNGLNCTLNVANNETFAKLKISAISQGDDTKSDNVIVNVVGPPIITDVTVSPKNTTVQKGTTQQFNVDVKGENLFDSNVTWKVTGGVVGTTIDAAGKLTVSNSETATSLILTATSVGNTSKKDTVVVNITSTPVTRYLAQVIGGTGSGEYQQGNTVAIKAAPYSGDREFVKWAVSSGRVNFEDMYSNSTTFIMPDESVRVYAIYKNADATWVKVGGVRLDSTNKYLFQNEWMAAEFIPNTGTLILDGYSGGVIEYNSNIKADLNIILEGTNNITTSGAGEKIGVWNNSGGNINITATGSSYCPTPTLNVNVGNINDNAYGIATKLDGGDGADINISGDAKVIVEVNSPNSTADGLFAANTITISDNVSLSVIVDGIRTNGIHSGQNMKFNTDGDITVQSNGTTDSLALSCSFSGKINLDKVHTMLLKSKRNILYPSISYDESKFAVNSHVLGEHKISEYRYGTPYTVNVISGSGSGQYLVDDEVTVTANDPQTFFEFLKWEAINLTGPNLALNPMTFIMPARNISLTATYKDIGVNLTVIDGTGGGKYNPGDTVTVTAKAPKTNYKFDRWEGIESTSITAGSITSPEIKFKMPSSDIELSATYKDNVFNKQPLDNTGYVGDSISFNWTLNDYEGVVAFAFLQIDEGGTWESTTYNLKDLYSAPGSHTINVKSNTVGSEKYRLMYYIGLSYFYSDEFTITWEIDPDKPIITLIGDETVIIEKGTPYTDAGATALDKYNNDITSEIDVVGAEINTSIVGTYTITYNVTDNYGKAAIQIKRTVIVSKESTVVYGDVDGTPGISANDALLVLQHVLGKITLSGDNLLAADVDGVPGVSANDALLILQKVLGKITKFPVEP